MRLEWKSFFSLPVFDPEHSANNSPKMNEPFQFLFSSNDTKTFVTKKGETHETKLGECHVELCYFADSGLETSPWSNAMFLSHILQRLEESSKKNQVNNVL